MKKEPRNNGYEFEPEVEATVFVLAELPAGNPATASVNILSQGFKSKFGDVTVVDASVQETWDSLNAFSQDATSYFLTNPGELITAAKPVVTVAFLNWNTSMNFIDNLILYGQALNPLVEELLMCDIFSLLSCQQGKEIQNKMAKAGILQNCYEGFNMRDLNERIMSKSVSQQRMRLQTCDYILRRANILEDQLLVRKPKYTKESNRAK